MTLEVVLVLASEVQRDNLPQKTYTSWCRQNMALHESRGSPQEWLVDMISKAVYTPYSCIYELHTSKTSLPEHVLDSGRFPFAYPFQD